MVGGGHFPLAHVVRHMIALVFWLLFHRPMVYSSNVTVNRAPVQDYNPDTDPCLGLEAGEWHRCQPRVIYLGEIDARPRYWPDNKELDAPKSWPEYDTEKR